MKIGTISNDFVYDYRTAIVPITTACIPAAFEAIRLFKGIYQDPTSIKRNLADLKNSIHSAFHKRENESHASFYKRWRINAAITTIAAFVIGGALTAPFLILPAAFAIPAALCAAYSAGNLLYHFYHNPISIGGIKDYLADAFKQREQETLQEFHQRRWKAIGKIFLYSTIFTATVGAAINAPYIIQSLFQIRNVWELTKFIPFQTKAVIFAEYVILSLLHLIQAYRHWIKSDFAQTTAHLTAAISALVFPLWYLLVPGHEMRLHHSFTGLLLQLAPWQAIRTFGAIITLDSALYFTRTQRGYLVMESKIINYDYMNAVYEDFSSVLQNLTAVSLFEKVVDFLQKKPPQDYVAASSSSEASESSFASSLPETTYISSGLTA